MPANYVLLEKITVGAAGASSVTFSGIPQTGYTDLVVKMSARGTDSAARVVPYLQFNGSTSSYSAIRLYGQDSSTTGSAANEGGTNAIYSNRMPAAGATANTFGNMEFYIPNYTSSNYKSNSSESATENNSSTNWNLSMVAGLWSNTAAITSITVTPDAGSFAQYSTFYLYGVAKLGTTPVIVPYATGGDTIMTDGTYWYHTFISSGTFTPASGKTLTCDYLVVAGGAAGGANKGAGGGAGGLRSTVTATGGGGSLESALSLGASAYTVTVGAGGARNTSSSGNNGSNSVFSTITSTGGGAGGSNLGTSNGATGGSGGGGGGGATSTGGVGTANQGFAGGIGVTGTYDSGGGGGGASAVGQPGLNTLAGGGGDGGNGVATSISGSSVTYGGGGGGGDSFGTGFGLGGTGGGGNGGAPNVAGTSGTANTGGAGGGAGDNSATAGNGGSGIVIVRYAV